MGNEMRESHPSVRWERGGKGLDYLSLAMTGYRELSVEIQGFSIKPPQAEGGEFLLVLRGLDGEGRPVVAFHSATELCEVFAAVMNRLRNGTLTWRPDQFAR
jgi:hypothetical protein